MTEPIEGLYFNWLCAKVVDSNLDRNLMVILYRTEFVWIIPGDQNRAEDGLELRQEFLTETRNEIEDEWEREPCSVLEFLIAFAKRASFQMETPVKDWFWIFLENLGLSDFRHQTIIDKRRVEHILHDFIWRQYDHRGFGGLFPLPHTRNDQRDVEVWYQFQEWVEYQQLF